MKFLKLVMQAFGPFKNKVEINFDSLNKNGMFLITGPTGSGKTTIFDAICYALFGKLSSNSSALEKVRSDYAKEDIMTYVELEFMLSNKLYYVKRNPQHDSILKDNNKIGAIRSDALLKYDDITITNVKAVDNRIKEILGLDEYMFRQVVMLPQNEFKQLLFSRTSEKQDIFRNIFSTQFINNFQQKILEDCKEKSRDVEKNVTILNTLISQVDDKYKELDSKAMQNYEDIISDIDNIVSSSNNDLDLKKNEYDNKVSENKKLNDTYLSMEELNKKIDSYKELSDKLKELDNDEYINNYRTVLEKSNNANRLKEAINNKDSLISGIKDLENSIIDLDNDEKSKNVLKDEYSIKKLELENRKPEIDEFREQRIKLNQEKQASKTKDELHKEFLRLDEELNDYNIDKENFTLEQEELLKEKEIKFNELEEIKTHLEDISALYKEKEELNEELLHLKEIKKKLDDKNDIIEQIRQFDTEISKLRADSIEVSGKKASLERTLKLNLAHTLAKDLVSGKPCPVCGSTEHPNLAILNSDVSQSDLDDILKKNADINAAMDLKYEMKKTLAQTRTNIEDYLAEDELVKKADLDLDNIDEFIGNDNINIQKLTDRINEHNEYNQKYSEANYNYELLLDKIKANEEAIKKIEDDNASRIEELRKAEIKLEVYKDTRELSIIDSEIDSLTEKIKQYEIDYKEANDGELKALNDIIEIRNKKGDVKNEISALEAKKEIYDKDILELEKLFSNKEEYELCLNTNYDEITNYVKDYDDAYAITKNKISELESDVVDKNVVDLLPMKEEISKNDEEIKALNEEIICLDSKIKTISKQLTEIKSNYNLMKDKIALRNRLKHISDISNGQNASKMTFEQYVLGIYFEDVIEEANILLNDMSKSRYQLIKKTSLAGNGYKGLEISVFDNNTGATRDVTTLSGGESFIASLALALGLSNVIRRNKALVSFDTLFIDEGFGSLDAESLDQAYNILCGLRVNDRVIGIISHITELKNRISSQIVIKKTDFSSEIKILD